MSEQRRVDGGQVVREPLRQVEEIAGIHLGLETG
jgi:hypothetical protein